MNVVDYERLGKFVYNENKRLHSYDGNPSIVYKTGARAWNVHDDVQRFPEDVHTRNTHTKESKGTKMVDHI